jgi:hypothetical protein
MDATTTTVRGLRVAELAAAVGLGADTIRVYEKTGLLLALARTPVGYRPMRRPLWIGCQRGAAHVDDFAI